MLHMVRLGIIIHITRMGLYLRWIYMVSQTYPETSLTRMMRWAGLEVRYIYTVHIPILTQ